MDAQLLRPLVILLVEDSAADARFLQEILQEVPISTTLKIATTGEEALAILRKLDEDKYPPMPDVMLLDLHLPKKDGYEVLAELNTDTTLRQLPVWVFITVENDPTKEILERQGLAAAGYLLKPVGVEVLTQLLRHLRS